MTRPSSEPDPRVDEHIDALPEWQQAVCHEVRAIAHAADPEVEETIKRRVQPYFVMQGNVCALLATKDHLNVFLYDGAIVPDPEGIITGGHDNQTARTVAVYEGETLNASALQTMFEEIIAINRVGGWRRLKRVSAPPQETTLKTVQRMRELTSDWEQIAALLEDGLQSPHDVVALGEEAFVTTYGPRLGRADQARRIFGRAENGGRKR